MICTPISIVDLFDDSPFFPHSKSFLFIMNQEQKLYNLAMVDKYSV